MPIYADRKDIQQVMSVLSINSLIAERLTTRSPMLSVSALLLLKLLTKYMLLSAESLIQVNSNRNWTDTGQEKRNSKQSRKNTKQNKKTIHFSVPVVSGGEIKKTMTIWDEYPDILDEEGNFNGYNSEDDLPPSGGFEADEDGNIAVQDENAFLPKRITDETVCLLHKTK